jgi:mRNA interferase RelE/StbE
MNCEVQWTRSAEKELNSLPRKYGRSILNAILDLKRNPLPSGARKFKGINHFFRIRIGKYRVLYSFESKRNTITIYKVGHRKDVYKHLI